MWTARTGNDVRIGTKTYRIGHMIRADVFHHDVDIGPRSNVSVNDQEDSLWAHSTPPLVHITCTRSKQGIPGACIQSRCTLPESGSPPHCALIQ